jgi:hypothetical protein
MAFRGNGGYNSNILESMPLATCSSFQSRKADSSLVDMRSGEVAENQDLVSLWEEGGGDGSMKLSKLGLLLRSPSGALSVGAL